MMYAILLLLAAAPAPEAAKPKPLPPGVVRIAVGDLHCKTCASRVARRLYKTPGVMRVRADLKNDVVWVTLQRKKRVELARLWAATKVDEVRPVELRIDERTFGAKDFEKQPAETVARPVPRPPAR